MIVRPKERGAFLARLKAEKTVSEPHAFVRARADLFYELLARLRPHLPETPAIWISGDCHGENVGAVADAHGSASMDLNDLDETTIGDPLHDVLRLGLAILVAARSRGISGVESVAIAQHLLEGYRTAIARRSPRHPVALDQAPKRFRRLLRDASRQTHEKMLARRVPLDERGRRRFVLGERYLPLSKPERAAIEELVARPAIRALAASMTDDATDAPLELVDAAFRVAGTGSLGCFRVAALVRLAGRRKKKGGELRLLDVKQALPTRAIARPPRSGGANVPARDAERVVAGARALVPGLGDRMIATSVLGHEVVVRELMPQEHKASLAGLVPGEAPLVARHLGEIVGRAHGRQIEHDVARVYVDALGGRSRGVAPDWLFRPLVDLVGAHEAEYLRHCAAHAVHAHRARARTS